jgi:hypothetical protein
MEEVDARYQRAESMLDKDFHKRFRLETPSRLFELEMACRILDAGYETERLPDAKKLGAPDFSIRFDDHILHVECVCATEGENIDKVDSECEITMENIGGCESFCKVGLDQRLVSRFSSVIKDKSELVKGYRERGIIKENDKVVLAVTAYFFTNRELIGGRSEFEKAIARKTLQPYITPEGGVTYDVVDNRKRDFVKSGRKMRVSDAELDSFNAFVYLDVYGNHETCYAYINIGRSLGQLLEKVCGTKPFYNVGTSPENI